MNTAHMEREVLDMIKNRRTEVVVTKYKNYLESGEIFKMSYNKVRGFSVFYWIKRQYLYDGNILYVVW